MIVAWNPSACPTLRQVGIMARESLEASAMIYFFVFPTTGPRNSNNGGYEFTCASGGRRPARPDTPRRRRQGRGLPTPSASPSLASPNAEGRAFKTYSSMDGKIWNPYNEFAIDFPATMLLV